MRWILTTASVLPLLLALPGALRAQTPDISGDFLSQVSLAELVKRFSTITVL